jgi:hypothetical protein
VLVDVAAGDERHPEKRERGRPGDEDETAGGRMKEVLGGDSDQPIFGVDGAEAAEPGEKGKEQTLRDEGPGENSDDGRHLATEDGAEAAPIPPQSAVPATVPRRRRAVCRSLSA